MWPWDAEWWKPKDARRDLIRAAAGWHHSTVWRKLNGASPITQADELAIRQALILESRQKACPART
jgi:hypothetical protein